MPKTTRNKIDYSKYRKQELVDSITSLVDVKAVYGRAFLTTLFCILVAAVITGFAYWTSLDGLIFNATLGVGCLFGLLFGIAISFCQFINRSLGNMSRIVDLLLELTKEITGDIGNIRSGETEMPSASELVKGAYGQVVLPMVENTIADQLGFLGKPVLFVYRMTLGQIVRWTIKLLPADTIAKHMDAESADEVAGKIMSGAEKIADNEERIVSSLTRIQKTLGAIGWGLRMFLMLPWIFGLSILIVATFGVFALISHFAV